MQNILLFLLFLLYEPVMFLDVSLQPEPGVEHLLTDVALVLHVILTVKKVLQKRRQI